MFKTQQQILNDLQKQKKLQDLYLSEMAKAKVIAPTPNKQELTNYIVRTEDIPKLNKLPGESDADYNARLEVWKVENQAKLIEFSERERETLRNNLRQIIGNNQQIYEIMSEIPPEAVYNMNRYWNRIKKSIEDNFTTISFEDLKNVFQQVFIILLKASDKDQALKNLKIDDEVQKIADITTSIQDAQIPKSTIEPAKGIVIPEGFKDVYTKTGRLKSAVKEVEENKKLDRIRVKEAKEARIMEEKLQKKFDKALENLFASSSEPMDEANRLEAIRQYIISYIIL